MGHWERYMPIAHLAEAAGIRNAIEAFDFSTYEGPISIFGGDLSYVCAVRGKCARNDGRTPIGPVGQLYACIYGDKYLVGSIYGHDLGYALGPDNYSTYFEDIDPELVEKAKREHPSLCSAAQERMKAVLEHVVRGSKVTNIKNRAIGLELRPQIAKFLRMHGPATCDEILRGIKPLRLTFDRYGVLDALVKEGFLKSDYDKEYRYYLSEEADQMLSDYEPIEVPATPEGKLIASLSEMGPLSTADIAFEIGSSVQRVRTMLRKLADEGVIEASGRGPSRRYALT